MKLLFTPISVSILLLAAVSVHAAETAACTEPVAWFGSESTEACWLNAPFGDGTITSCNQLEPDEDADCVALCTNCFNYCNAQCVAPTTIFQNNVDPLVAGCSCVQSTIAPAGSASGLETTVAIIAAAVSAVAGITV